MMYTTRVPSQAPRVMSLHPDTKRMETEERAFGNKLHAVHDPKIIIFTAQDCWWIPAYTQSNGTFVVTAHVPQVAAVHPSGSKIFSGKGREQLQYIYLQYKGFVE